jgi:predicted RNA polymerase sigma factor
MRGLLGSVLTPGEIRLLIEYVGAGLTQAEIGRGNDCAQTTISHRLRRSVAKLQVAGIVVKLPGRGRRKGRVVAFDPAAIDRLQTSDGGRRGKWIDRRHRGT